jgi:GNAT superfamily N-acetyltransferase
MEIYEATKNDFIISTDRSKIDIAFVHNYLCNESYWAKNIPPDIVKKSIEGALCFAVYHQHEQTLPAVRQVGFARVITDHATFGYIADVFILEKFRGKGLGKWLMQCIRDHPQLQGFRRWMLATKDAHGLYAQFDFKPLDKPERIMRWCPFDEYPESSFKPQA